MTARHMRAARVRSLKVTINSKPAVEPDFISRHIGPDHDDVAAMLKVVGQPSLEAMLDTAMPGVIRTERALRLDAAPTEEAVIRELRALASRNTVLTQMIGLGYYDTVTPAVIKRNVRVWGNFWMIALLLLIFPVYALFYRWNFENKRWENSDYAPAIFRIGEGDD